MNQHLFKLLSLVEENIRSLTEANTRLEKENEELERPCVEGGK